MTRFRMIGVAMAAAALTLMMSVPAGADRYRYRDGGFSFGFSYGSPYRYVAYPGYRPYPYRYGYARPYRYNYPVAPRPVYRGGQSAHVNWCYNRYRSYRAWDNSYQPYNAPRRQCRSPYWG